MAGPLARLNQDEVDVERLRALKSIVSRAKKLTQYISNDPGWRWPIFHLWFPEPRSTYIELRQGNPPPDRARPPWLKGVHLELDLNVGIPRTAKAMIARNKAMQEKVEDQVGVADTEARDESVESTGLAQGLVAIARRAAEQRANSERAAGAATKLAVGRAALEEKRRTANRVRRRRQAVRH